MKHEVERRFLTTSDEWRQFTSPEEKEFIVQGYPDELQADGVFGRIRDTLKSNGTHVYQIGEKQEAVGIHTPEDERETLQTEAERLMNASGIYCLRKWREFIHVQEGVTIMVDRFTHIRNERVDDLVISEIEFEGEAVKLAESFEPPLWIGREISGQHEWSNFSLCREGIPIRFT